MSDLRVARRTEMATTSAKCKILIGGEEIKVLKQTDKFKLVKDIARTEGLGSYTVVARKKGQTMFFAISEEPATLKGLEEIQIHPTKVSG